MGMRLIHQRRGKGSAVYKSPSHRYIGAITLPSWSDKPVRGEVIDILDCPGHSSPLAFIQFEDEQACLVPAVQGLRVGAELQMGDGAKAELGSIISLKDAPAGEPLCAIELAPGSGPKVVRTSGTCARIVAKEAGKVELQMPSRKRMIVDERCRAIFGMIAAGGVKDKPFVKAGNKYHAKLTRNKLYPIVSGVAMNCCNHPFGSGRGHSGKQKCVARGASPGRKVGSIASKRTGRRKR